LVAAGLCYLAITIPLTYCINWLDRRLREGPGHVSVAPDPDLTVVPGGVK